MNKRLFDEVAKVAKKKEVHMEDVPWHTVQSIVKAIQFSIELNSQKHLEVSSRMELIMEQMMISNEPIEPPSIVAKD